MADRAEVPQAGGADTTPDPRPDEHARRPRSGAPSRRPRARRGEGARLRGEVVEAARRLLATTGDPADLSLRAVAREVGIATTSVYLHFATLDELLAEVKVTYFTDFGATLDAAADAAGDRPGVRVRARGLAYARWGAEHPGEYRAMFEAPTLAADAAAQVARAGAEVFAAMRDEAVEAAGRPDADLLAIHLWTALHGTVSLRTARPQFPWPDLTVEVDSLVTHLLGVPPATP
ncbi:TetR/AcrR family transcriptional regulator [Actinotalea sp. M2MS4P-6]|uniref:TetR/AcrR family transcriptional regulator n=1 Tax=Actinotalea sp. M2MS4P-6 TaxID=2983762 RepID=UPI0021E4A4DB|nr:TetR/AcrR family transcriptional regulator [Actinotalea sp. M2MS4P-6]